MPTKIISYPDTLPGTIALGKALLVTTRGKSTKYGVFEGQAVIAIGRKNLILVLPLQPFNTFGAIDQDQLNIITFPVDADEVPGDYDAFTYRLGVDMLGSPALHAITGDPTFFESELDLIKQQSYRLIGNCDEPWLSPDLYNTFQHASAFASPLALQRRMEQQVLDAPVYQTLEYDSVNASVKGAATPIENTYFETILDQVPDDAIVDMLHSLLPEFETFPTYNGVPIFKGDYSAFPQSKLKGNLLWTFATPHLTRQRADGEYISVFKCSWKIPFVVAENQVYLNYIPNDPRSEVYIDEENLPDFISNPAGGPNLLLLEDYIQNSWFSVYTKDIINSRFDTDHSVKPIAAALEPGTPGVQVTKTLNIFINGTTTDGDYNVRVQEEGDHHSTRLGLTLLDNILFDVQYVYALAGEGLFTFDPNLATSRLFPYDNSPQHTDYFPDTIALRFFTSSLTRTTNDDGEFTYEGRISFNWLTDWGGNFTPVSEISTSYLKPVDVMLYPEIIDSWWLPDLVPDIPTHLANKGWIPPYYYPVTLKRARSIGHLGENRTVIAGSTTTDYDAAKQGYIAYNVGFLQSNRTLHYCRVLYEDYFENVNSYNSVSRYRNQQLKSSHTVLDFISKDIDFDGVDFTVADSEMVTYNAIGSGAAWSQSKRPTSSLDPLGYRWQPHYTTPGTFTLNTPAYDVMYSREVGLTELAYRVLAQTQVVTAVTRLESGKYGDGLTYFKYADPPITGALVVPHIWGVREAAISEGLVFTDNKKRFIAEPTTEKHLFARVGSDIYQSKADNKIYKNGEFICDPINSIVTPDGSPYEIDTYDAIASLADVRSGATTIALKEFTSVSYTTYGSITTQEFDYSYLKSLDPIEYLVATDGSTVTSKVNAFNISMPIPKFAVVISGDTENVQVMSGIGDRIHHSTGFDTNFSGIATQLTYQVLLKPVQLDEGNYPYVVLYPYEDTPYRSVQGVFSIDQAATAIGETITYKLTETGQSIFPLSFTHSFVATCIDKKTYIAIIRRYRAFWMLPDVILNEFMTPFYFRSADELIYTTREQFQDLSINLASQSFLYTQGLYLNRTKSPGEEE